jgi:hypothetical protein
LEALMAILGVGAFVASGQWLPRLRVIVLCAREAIESLIQC